MVSIAKPGSIKGLDPKLSLADIAQPVMAAKLAETLAFVNAVRADDDIEAVHDMRIACKRLRESLRVLQPCFRRRRFERAFTEVDGLNDTLGAVRDADVMLARFRALSADSPPGPGLAAITASIQGRRVEAYSKLLQLLDAWEAGDGRQVVEQLVHKPASLRRKGTKGGVDPSRSTVRNGLTMVWRRLEQTGPLLLGEVALDNVAKLHRMRIMLKRLRYTMEVVAFCYGNPFGRCLGTVEQLQELLGQVHDCDVRAAEISTCSATATRQQKKELGAVLELTRDERAQLCEQLAGALARLQVRNLAQRTADAMGLSKKEARAWAL